MLKNSFVKLIFILLLSTGVVFLLFKLNYLFISNAKGATNYDGTFGMVLDFEGNTVGQYSPAYLWYWQWGVNSSSWRATSTLDIVQDGSNKYLRFWVNDDILNANSHFNAPNSSGNLNSIQAIMSIGGSLGNIISPRTDTVRVKFKIEQGTIGLAFGSPVSQLGNSDVLTKVKYLSPVDHDDCIVLSAGWLQCDFDLNYNLIRNIRRSNYSANNVGVSGTIKNLSGDEIIYYSRWVQEAMSLYLVSYDSNDNKILSGDPIVLIDDIEFINNGYGKTFPAFSTLTSIGTVNDFETDINAAATINFNWPNAGQPPALLSHSSIANSGSKSLKIENKTAEEYSWTGINNSTGEGANAVSFDMRVEYANNNFPYHSIDFIALATPSGDTFPWSGLIGSNGFDYQLAEASTSNIDFAVYHARRFIPEDQWVTVTIPFADFVTAYGSGSMISNHQEQKLLTGDQISVVGLQTSFRQANATTTIYIDSVRYVNVPGTTSDLRSYYQAYADNSCVESWSCSSWSTCSSGSQTRSCIDANSCGSVNSRPITTQSCVITPDPVTICTESWSCGSWSTCSGGNQSRTCTDANSCGTTDDRPAISQSCTTTPTTPGGGTPGDGEEPPIVPPSEDALLDGTPHNFAISGRLVKTPNDSAVYYLTNNTRYLFVNQVTFFSWRSGAWANNPVEVISQSEFDNLATGPNVIVRPGAKLIRFNNSSIIYAVKPGGKLCQAEANYGDNWRDHLIIIQNGFETNYTKEANCKITTGSVLPDATLIRYQGSTNTWYIQNGTKRLISTSAMTKYGFRNDSVITNVPTSMSYTEGAIIP